MNLDTIQNLISKRRALILVAVFAASLFAYSYWNNGNRPNASTKLGWDGWYDQGQYLLEAQSIHTHNLAPQFYQYPLGYPLVGSPFTNRLHSDPFLPFNFTAFVAIIVLFYLTVQELLGQPAAVFGSFLLMLATPLLEYIVTPWTTTPVALTLAFWVYVAFVVRRLRYHHVILGGALLALTYMARGGGELVFMVPLCIAIFFKFWRQPKFWQLATALALVFGSGVALNLWWTHKIFGSYVQPYFKAVAQYGFSARKVPRTIWSTTIFSGQEGEFWQPLLVRSPWFILSPIGFWISIKNRSQRWLHVGLALSTIIGVVVTSSFTNYGAFTLKFHSLHYLKLWYPVIGLYAMYALAKLAGWGQPKRANTKGVAGH